MSELTPVREAVDTLAARAPAPDFDDLRRRAARRRRRRTAMTAAAAAGSVAAIVVGAGMIARDSTGSDRPSPADEPTMGSSAPSTARGSAASPDCTDDDSLSCQAEFDRRLDEILGSVPGWTVGGARPAGAPPDLVVNGPCEGRWGRERATGVGHGSAGTAQAGLAEGLFHARWPSRAEAAAAADRLVANLASCERTAWRTQPIPQRPGAVLASSPDALAWIQQSRSDMWILQVVSSEGPPPPPARVAVAEWLADYIDWKWVT